LTGLENLAWHLEDCVLGMKPKNLTFSRR